MSLTRSECLKYTYTYDGQRITKTLDGQTTVYHYDLSGQLIAETTADGTPIKAYVWLDGQPLAQVAADNAVYYYHNDHLGTPQRLTDATGTLVWSADYLPFGQVDVTLATIENNLRFSGQYYDSETGLHYNYWRYYDPGLGRYLRADPIGLDGGINPYAYVQNDPVNIIDPFGLKEYITFTVAFSGGLGKAAGEFGNIYALDPSSGEIQAFSYGGVGPGIGSPKAMAVTVEIGGLDVSNNLSDIAGLGAAVSFFATAGLKGFAAQYSGNLKISDNISSLGAGYALGRGWSLSGLFTYTLYTGPVDINSLPENIQNLIRQIIDQKEQNNEGC